MSEQLIPLTNTERERFRLHVPDSEVGDCLCGWVMGDGSWAGEWSKHMADVLAERDARVRAAALAPIQVALTEWAGTRDLLRAQSKGLDDFTADLARREANVLDVVIGRLAALAAAGVDAAPNETTTVCPDCKGLGFDELLEIKCPCNNGRRWAAVPSVAAPNETTTEACGSFPTCSATGPHTHRGYDPKPRAAVPSGHEQEGDHRG